MTDIDIFQFVLEYEKQAKALEDASKVLRESKVNFVPLKGALLRPYYESPWMRECSDIDIYVKPGDIRRADKQLRAYGFKKQTRCSHHIAYITPNGVLLELHFVLAESTKLGNRADVVDEKFVNNLFADNPERTAEYYIYHLLHMLAHFYDGGCGKKFFNDLWILNHLVEHSADYEEKKSLLLEKARLVHFDEECTKLSEYWFGNFESCDEGFANYVLSGGNFGTADRKAAANSLRKGGRLKYIATRLFPPYAVMCGIYPSLCKTPIFLPFTWVMRAVSLVGHGHLSQMNEEISVSKSISSIDIEKQKEIFTKLDIL